MDLETKKIVGEPDPDHPVRKFWFKILRLYLLPALTLIRGNAVCAVEVWNIIRQYETTARWSLYGEWKSTLYKSHPELRIREVQADRESKGILRRLSHNTIDTLAGTVAKLAHSNPCIFFMNAVNQIMAYDNLANVVIQALRYVTNMGFDVLVFIVLDALANPMKARVKDDGVNTSDWLQSTFIIGCFLAIPLISYSGLASFTGMLFRRYSADLSPVLKYIVHQLHNGQTTEIVVLRELIWKMAGIEPLPSLSESQIAAMAGGPALRIEAVASATRGARLDPGDVALKGPQRLGRGLLESSLALPLLIQVAQQRQACVFNAPDAHLKSLASLYDTVCISFVCMSFETLNLMFFLRLTEFYFSTWNFLRPLLLCHLRIMLPKPCLLLVNLVNSMAFVLRFVCRLSGLCFTVHSWLVIFLTSEYGLNLFAQTAALSMQEQERVANEEAEKRLKAALTAKREPANVSRMASPSVGTSGTSNEIINMNEAPVDMKPEGNVEDIIMEADTVASAASVPLVEVCPDLSGEKVLLLIFLSLQSPWLPELAALFEDIKKVVPGNAFDVIGYVHTII
jgi:THO complex subunit 2